MKKVKSSILAFLLIAGVSGAFATKIAKAAGKRSTSYNWTVYDRNGVQTGTLSNKTEAQAESATGCSSGTPTKCAVATGGPTIYYTN
ncbi:hypothetical protein HDF18_08435 [Mucilaginibacter sp. X5P1]|uniref:hypothetical protein n=1 Tax=Mucilaginibacter sp. X5P1 TaxID=2723088 RepID=UPI00160F8850|nr:hypothetical protein [Mucilaginibacter sp. X5P1]MBB6137684.1 hypothetical protein [Mucilaginibacter sp. X5P1]